MKLERFNPLELKIQQFLFMKRLTYTKRFFLEVPKTIGFPKETNSPLTS